MLSISTQNALDLARAKPPKPAYQTPVPACREVVVQAVSFEELSFEASTLNGPSERLLSHRKACLDGIGKKRPMMLFSSAST